MDAFDCDVDQNGKTSDWLEKLSIADPGIGSENEAEHAEFDPGDGVRLRVANHIA